MLKYGGTTSAAAPPVGRDLVLQLLAGHAARGDLGQRWPVALLT
jgi:hypothetical protein